MGLVTNILFTQLLICNSDDLAGDVRHAKNPDVIS